MNMICSPQKTCACRPDMKWNSETGECQIFMDVDCSDIDVNSEPATAVSNTSATTMKPETVSDTEFVKVLEDKNITNLTAKDTLKDCGDTWADFKPSNYCCEASTLRLFYTPSTSRLIRIQVSLIRISEVIPSPPPFLSSVS